MADIVSQFQGLPVGQLIAGPIIEVAKAQQELNNVYLRIVTELSYKDPKDPSKGTKTLDFVLERMVTDGQGNQQKVPMQVHAPVISCVPVPCFVMDTMEVDFTMEVKEQTVDKSSSEQSASASGSFSFWGFHASFSGSVTHKSENQRTSDHSAKYDIKATAKQQPAAEGMARVMQIVASTIEPIPVGGGQ